MVAMPIYPATRPDLFAESIIELVEIESNQKRETLRFNLEKAHQSKLSSREEHHKR